MNEEVKDFEIQVGNAGAWSDDPSQYTEHFGVFQRFGIYPKHVPYSIMKKIKSPIVQSWPDEEGDDVFLPVGADGAPATVHDSTSYKVTFVYHKSSQEENINDTIDTFINLIRGRWLRIYDWYTQIGYDGVYLNETDDDPQFRRRDMETCIFELEFKINGKRTSEPFAD